MNCWDKTDVAQQDSSLLTLSVFSHYIQISKFEKIKKVTAEKKMGPFYLLLITMTELAREIML